MSDMKCPICGGDLEQYDTGFVCYRHCLNGKSVWGSEETLKELERTRKALDVAIDALKEYEDRDSYDCNGDWCGCEYSTAHKALEQITALEQKYVK